MSSSRLDAKWMTNKTKILFPGDGITKQDLASYYQRIAPLMLPLMKGHPVAMLRYPDGIKGESFYQKNTPDYFPDWIKRAPITNRDGSVTSYVLCQNVETLVYLAYQACITPHLWLSRADKLNYPDRMIFDLDPGEKTTFETIKKTALLIKGLLDELGFIAFPMTTGSRGIHVTVPLRRTRNFAFVHTYSHGIAAYLASKHPDMLTVDIRKEAREGRLFIDAMRNTYGHLAVSPYGVRGLPKAPIATPITWQEVSSDTKLQSQSYNISNIFERIQSVGNVWEDFFKVKNIIKRKSIE